MFARRFAALCAVLCATSLALPLVAQAATARAAAPSTQGTSLTGAPVSGTTRTHKRLTGRFTALQFVPRGGKPFVIGVLNGRVGHRRIKQALVTLPVSTGAGAASTAAVCPVLHLVLGPVHLNLLGLHVDLNRVVLNITAQSGNGLLLGNLICAVANLLNTQALSSNTSGLLNLFQSLLNSPGLLTL